MVDEVESDFGDMEKVEIASAPVVAEGEGDDDNFLEVIEAEEFPPV